MKLKYDKLLSNFGFNCNLRHYTMGFRYGYIYPYQNDMKNVYDRFFKDNPSVIPPKGGAFALPQTGNAPSVINTAVGRCSLTPG